MTFNIKTLVIIMVLLIIVSIILIVLYGKMKSSEAVSNSNVQAFLLMIRHAEGTSGPDGYRTMFTGKTFDSFDGHPNISNCSGSLCSTAAGAYQFLYKTWVYLKARLQLSDFSPKNQDLAAIELIRENNALDDVIAGRVDVAISKVNKVWASMPGSPYGQPTKTLAELKNVYQYKGGNLA